MTFMQYGGLLAARNRRLSTLTSNPLWGPRRNLAVPAGMIGTALISVTNLYGPGLQRVFGTTPIPGMFWGLPFCFGLGILTMDELRKLIVRTYPKVRFRSLFVQVVFIPCQLVYYRQNGMVNKTRMIRLCTPYLLSCLRPF
jgi:hypothetical protein